MGGLLDARAENRKNKVVDHDPIRFGHLIFSPSSHRIYNSSAMGDLRVGELGGPSLPAKDGECPCPEVEDVSSSCSTTTNPLEVISLRRVIRLCGKRPRLVVI
jgi:hypothetical protein